MRRTEGDSGVEMMGKTLSDMVVDFFEYNNSNDHQMQRDQLELTMIDEEELLILDPAEAKAFWDSQNQLLQEALSRSSSSAETRVRRAAEEAIQSAAGSSCSCMKKECRHNCKLRDVADRLRDAGYNSALCKSKWQSSPDIPSGEHTYIDVSVDSKNGKRSPIRVIIELNFRAEFEMARGSAEYKALVSCLPEVFVGKPERMRSMIRIMCDAAKRCMKDNKMHMAPWRKHKYMMSKWLGTYERMMPVLSPWLAADSERRQSSRPRASMLTFDLHCATAVEVV